MIRFLQHGGKTTKYMLGGILTVICLSMCLYLIPGFMSDTTATGARTGVLATVGGEDIQTAEVQRAAVQQLRAQKYPDALLPFFIPQIANQYIQRASILYEGNRMGLQVSDEEMRDFLRNGQYAQIFFPNGTWIGQKKYEELLTDNGTTVEEFEKQLRKEVVTNKLLATVVAGIDVTPAEIEKAYKDKNAKVKFDYAVINADDVQKEIKPSDAELKAFFDSSKAKYQNSIPEKREVRYFVLNENQAKEKVALTPADLQKYYDDHKSEFSTPERVRVRHILVKTPSSPDGKVDQKAVDAARAKAQDLLKQIRGGADFAEIAKKNSEDTTADQGGELGWMPKGQTVPEFEKTAFSQNAGQISDLVQTAYGFHIIQTEEKEAAHDKPLAEVKNLIEPRVRLQKTEGILSEMAKKAQAEAKNGLDKAAAQSGVQVVQSNPVAKADSLPGIGPSPEVMQQVFAAKENDLPQAAHFGQGYAIFQVVKTTPARTPPLEEIKDRVTTDFKTERAGTLLSQKVQELADRAKSEHDLRKAAKELGATVKTSDLVGRTSQVPEIGAMGGAAAVAFTMKQGEISGPLNVGRNGAVLAVLENQEPSMGDDFAKAKDDLREQLVGQKRQMALELFISNLDARMKKDGKVKINNAEMDALTKKRG